MTKSFVTTWPPGFSDEIPGPIALYVLRLRRLSESFRRRERNCKKRNRK
jgi:hypothetical protein